MLLRDMDYLTKTGAGVSRIISDETPFSILDNITHSTKDIESIFVRIDKGELNINKDLIIGCVYRPPDGNCAIFLESYQDILDTIGEVECYISGDFNIDLGAGNTKAEQFRNTNVSSNFTPIITKPTRSQKASNTTIDNIFTSNPFSIGRSGIVISEITDHDPLFMTSRWEQKIKSKEHSKLL